MPVSPVSMQRENKWWLGRWRQRLLSRARLFDGRCRLSSAPTTLLDTQIHASLILTRGRSPWLPPGATDGAPRVVISTRSGRIRSRSVRVRSRTVRRVQRVGREPSNSVPTPFNVECMELPVDKSLMLGRRVRQVRPQLTFFQAVRRLYLITRVLLLSAASS
eukprot:4488016-Pleurochrysis_carterae.AAC.4